MATIYKVIRNDFWAGIESDSRTERLSQDLYEGENRATAISTAMTEAARAAGQLEGQDRREQGEGVITMKMENDLPGFEIANNTLWRVAITSVSILTFDTE